MLPSATPMQAAAKRCGVSGVRRTANALIAFGAVELAGVHMRVAADVAGFGAQTGDREMVLVLDDLAGLSVQRETAAVLTDASQVPVNVLVRNRTDEALTGTVRLVLELA